MYLITGVYEKKSSFCIPNIINFVTYGFMLVFYNDGAKNRTRQRAHRVTIMSEKFTRKNFDKRKDDKWV